MVGSDRLAQFQVDATRSILDGSGGPATRGDHRDRGHGSGKTRAFYLPALIDIAATVGEKRNGPHTLALYPRNELLRDQAREAVRVIESIGPLAGAGTARGGSRMLYGNTPVRQGSRGHEGRQAMAAGVQPDGRPRTSRAWTTTA